MVYAWATAVNATISGVILILTTLIQKIALSEVSIAIRISHPWRDLCCAFDWHMSRRGLFRVNINTTES